MNEQPRLTVILNFDSFRRSPLPQSGGKDASMTSKRTQTVTSRS
jgi:hypothetical protein